MTRGSAAAQRAHERHNIPDLPIVELLVPGRHGRVLADRDAALLDGGEQVLVGELVEVSLDGEIAHVGPEGLGLPPTVGAVAEIVVEFPNWPTLLSPQQRAAPLKMRAQVWPKPPAIATVRFATVSSAW